MSTPAYRDANGWRSGGTHGGQGSPPIVPPGGWCDRVASWFGTNAPAYNGQSSFSARPSNGTPAYVTGPQVVRARLVTATPQVAVPVVVAGRP